MPDVASQTFDLVGREVNATLAEARGALETYVEQPDNVTLLERCAQELHQVQGVLRLLEIYGAALLAEEMEHVAQYLLMTHSERKSQAESLDALMRAMVQLPSYLERVLAGGRDLALVLLPLLNDLRAVRGHALLSEGTLLLLNLKSDKQAQPLAAAPGAMTVEQWSRRLRARYQVGLIGWIRGERAEQNLEILAAVAHKLEQIATRQPVFKLWWVIGAVIEALQEKGLESGQSVKRLLGLGDREMRRLYEQGEARYAQSPPVELLNNLLYYVGRSESSGARVSAVRASFRLSELLPVDESIEQERENLSAPSVKLMQTVAAAIREDLAKVKDVLDIFVRRGAAQPQELSSQVELLRKIGDTLGVLGLGELRANVQSETERLRKIVNGSLKADEATLVEIAATLIGVEDKLDDQLVGMILPKDRELAQPAEDSEFQQVQAAVLRECIVNLARIKEAVTQSVGGTLDAAGLDSWQDLMRGMKAGLLLLGKARAVEVIGAITVQLRRVMQPGAHVLPPGFVDRLADAIVSVEYYMETLQAGRSDPWYMLDNAQACVQALEQQPTPPVPTVAPLEPAAYARTVQIPSIAPLPAPQPDVAAVDATAPTLAPSSTAKVAALVEHADPELMKLFIEEAHEELTRIQHCFAAWDHNPLERDSLVTVRRSFHTLKGSGRMVGARELAEFAWSIENLLNRVLDNTLTRSPDILESLRVAVSALPEPIRQLQTGEPVRADLNAISSRAHALAAGRQANARRTPERGEERAAEAQLAASAAAGASAAGQGPTMPASAAVAFEPSPVPGAPPAPATPAAESAARQAVPDDTLRDIYARETAAHVATVRGYLARESQRPEPHALPEDVYRACHTLSGSSKMAQARHGIRLAQPLDQWLRRAFSSGLGLGSEDLTLLGDCMAAMESVATHLDEPTGYFVNHWQLLERIERADKALDQRIAAAAAHSGIDAAIGAAETADEGAQQSDEAVDFDPEVAAIFTDEATELIDASERALSDWRSQPNSADCRLSLKRPLHTLKGGARMAGITPMGDLSHELETLVMSVDNGTVTADVAVFDVIQASLDELARMREQVINGRRVEPARAIIARLQRLSRSGAPASPGAPSAEMAGPPAAAPAAAPEPVDAESDAMLEKLNAELMLSGEEGVEPEHADSVHDEPVQPETVHAEPLHVEPVSEAPGPPPAPSATPAPSFAAPALHFDAPWRPAAGALAAASPFAHAHTPEPHT
ncbi:MAG TPA: Hpt domain-containing protein, partial [Steroidobacteraceae bacterium]